MAVAPAPLTVARRIKPLLFLLCLLPLVVLVSSDLGANPIEALLHGSGDWALRMLLVTLAVTPLLRLTGEKKEVATGNLWISNDRHRIPLLLTSSPVVGTVKFELVQVQRPQNL